MRPRTVVLSALGALALGLSVATTARVVGPSAAAFHGTAYAPPEPAHPFHLTGHHGAPVALEQFRGKPVLLFFGYVNCPDVCPLTLTKLQRVIGTLGKRGADVRVLLVTVDPARDTPEALAGYVARFGPQVVGLTGDSASLAATRAAYGVYGGPHPMRADMPMTHTQAVFGIDREGQLRVLLSMEQPDEVLAADIRKLASF